MRKIIVGSRKSNLALTQTKWVIEQLKLTGAPYEFEIKKIETKGDKILDVTLSKVGGKGLFVKEIEQAMYDEEIDMAVHSMKDMPSELPVGLTIASVPVREDYRDALISKNNVSLRELPEGAVVGTSSLRRASQILAIRPDIEIKPIRGNIHTRLKKLENEDFDAIVLAAAGLKRMGWDDEIITEYLETDLCLPAIGQGALAIECRDTDMELIELLAKINDSYTQQTVAAERTFLYLMNGSCQVPIAGVAHMEEDDVVLTALIASVDGKQVFKEEVRGTDPQEVGKLAAEKMQEQGAQDIITKAIQESESN
ncbi:hydroxymethylbilane synthase [Terribacillus saccharophilus]|jgi:hydroxymethylbilane synthase|uniref:Porphobilinogen deaminase n=1 Tax=Terribacillus saccharophilus TaxID=361277 RepID=A0A268H9F6_9BACI|nr:MULTISPECIES: hydroxymethylbilane synthase [Terribacillus]PAD36364.1 hydroxymethylbilane synthase [Terribacillus saccharophilus]PAD94988.1 hydroxymethylbilane synthase [Terribacillus saccharophilus]PAE00769.1 hydroxymethylbilane synthase [Terribacillus saccharophilus]PAE06512.1 hydroxymethylbilane synthase [Terribacillus saccharophilus]